MYSKTASDLSKTILFGDTLLMSPLILLRYSDSSSVAVWEFVSLFETKGFLSVCAELDSTDILDNLDVFVKYSDGRLVCFNCSVSAESRWFKLI